MWYVAPLVEWRLCMVTIEVDCLEQVTTTDVANLIDTHVKSRGLKPKTAIRCCVGKRPGEDRNTQPSKP
jgi:hypothetical protein